MKKARIKKKYKNPKNIREALENFITRDDNGRHTVEYCLGTNIDIALTDIKKIIKQKYQNFTKEKANAEAERFAKTYED